MKISWDILVENIVILKTKNYQTKIVKIVWFFSKIRIWTARESTDLIK